MDAVFISYRKTALLTAGPSLALIVLGLWQWRRAGLADFKTLSRLVSAGEILAGAAALGLSLAGLIYFGRLGREPMKSGAAPAEKFQDALPGLSRLTFGLGLSLPLALILAIFYELQYHWLHLDQSSHLEFLAFFLGLMALLYLGIFSVRLTAAIGKNSKSRPAGPKTIAALGRQVTVFEAPRLWALVRSVAEKTGAAQPDHLIVGLNEEFFATEAPVQLDWREEALVGRTLHLSLPGLAYLAPDEIRAVIGHELGHFAGEDTVHGLSFRSIYAKVNLHLKAIDQAAVPEDFFGFHYLISRPFKSLAEFFLNSFHLAVGQWNQEREAAADRAGASVAGVENLALALVRLALLHPKIERVRAEYLAEENHGSDGLLTRLRQVIVEQGLDDPAAYLQTSTAHPTDSHPPISRRLNDLGLEPDSALLERARDTSAAFTALTELGLNDEPAGEWPGLAAAVEETLAQAEDQREEMETILMRAAGLNGLERREFYESPWKRATLLCGGIWLFGAASMWIFGSPQGLVCLAVTSIFGYLLVKLLYRHRRPFLITTAEGFLVGGLEKEIPWAEVRYTLVSAAHWADTVTLVLRPDYRPPPFKKDDRCRYVAKTHQIVCSVYNLRRPIKRGDLSRILDGCLRGAQARAELEKRGLSLEPPDPAES